MPFVRLARRLVSVLLPALWLVGAAPAAAAPEGTLIIAMHFTPVTRWLDPAEGESTITPYLLLYALHDGLLKPMPGVGSGPSLAESWSMAKDMLSADFTLRAHAKFHNGEPVTSEDVKFSFERYRGGAAKVLKDAVKEIQTPAPNRVRFVFKEPWPDFSAFYGTFVASAGWVVPKKYVERVGEEGFRKAPIGAGPYKFVSLNPGVELVVEAFEGYWRAHAVPALQRHGRDDPGWLQAVGIRTRMRAMERGAFMTSWREKKLHGVVLTISGVSGNAATRLESFVTKNGAFAYGALPEVDDLFRRQARELDHKKREALLHQLQRILHEQVVQAPVYHLGFPIGVGPRVEDIMATAIPGFYMSPYEDLKLRRP